MKKYQATNSLYKADNLEAVKRNQATNPSYKAEHLEAVKRNQATNSSYKAENLEAVKRNQATNPSFKAKHLKAVKRNQATNPSYKAKHLEARQKNKDKTRDMLVTNKNHLALTREEYDKIYNGVVPSGLYDIEKCEGFIVETSSLASMYYVALLGESGKL